MEKRHNGEQALEQTDCSERRLAVASKMFAAMTPSERGNRALQMSAALYSLSFENFQKLHVALSLEAQQLAFLRLVHGDEIADACLKARAKRLNRR